jgi:hypothetical protein
MQGMDHQGAGGYPRRKQAYGLGHGSEQRGAAIGWRRARSHEFQLIRLACASSRVAGAILARSQIAGIMCIAIGHAFRKAARR